MSILQSALHSSTLHPSSDSTSSTPRLRKAASDANLLHPLIRLIRSPSTVFGDALRKAWPTEQAGNVDREKQNAIDARRHALCQQMSEATTFEDWRMAAIELDILEGNEEWKAVADSTVYDCELVNDRLDQLKGACISHDPARILFLIRTSLTRSLGNMGDLRLYKHSHIGTKKLIEDYITTTCDALERLLELHSSFDDHGLHPTAVLEQLVQTRQAFGRSALLLSGGGTFGMNHIGVVKVLWQARLLPRIVCGSSAGSIVAAVLGVKTDAELPATLEEFCTGEMDVFEKTGEEETVFQKLGRFAKYGAVFDIQHLIRVMKSMLGNMTFQEAYNRTRRITNISVSSAGLHELPRLLNYITSPNVIIWSAVAASCSVPLVFQAAEILAKDPKTGEEKPWNPSPQRWIDGSVDGDIPMTRLAEMFNVNHFIVSQVNPHVVPFLVGEDLAMTTATDQAANANAELSPGWLETFAGFARSEALHRMQQLVELNVLPLSFTKLRSVLSQKYSGDITILPTIQYAQFPRILQNPDPEFMTCAMLAGERATWPKLSRVTNHCAIELALDEAVQKLRGRIAFSPSQVDLRKMSLTSGFGRAQSPQSRSSNGRPSNKKRRSWCSDMDPRSQNDLKSKLKSGFGHSRRLRQTLSSMTRSRPSDVDPESGAADDEREDSQAYLSLPAKRKVTNVEPDFDSDATLSNPRSFSPSPTRGSEEDLSGPSPQILFPHQTQPPTPYRLGSRSPAGGVTIDGRLAALTMTASKSTQQEDDMSEPEKKYKRIFHRFGTRNAQNNAKDVDRLVVDVSGTRSMLLRRKKSRSLG